MNNNSSFHSLPLPTWARRGIVVPALLAILVGLGAFSLAPSAHAASANRSAVALAASGTVEGCPLGDACIYPVNAGWNNGHPEARGIYYYYGTYVLSNEFNSHFVFNNQTGSALVYLCYHADGTDCDGPLCTYGDAGDLLAGYNWVDTNLTPYNSIKLTAPKSGYC